MGKKDGYDIPDRWVEYAKSIHDINEKLRQSIIDGRQKSVETYFAWLDELTCVYSNLLPLFKQHEAIKRNN